MNKLCITNMLQCFKKKALCSSVLICALLAAPFADVRAIGNSAVPELQTPNEGLVAGRVVDK